MRSTRRLTPAARLVVCRPLGIGRRDQSQFLVEDLQQFLEFLRTVSIARSGQKLVARVHLSLDVGPLLGKQQLEDFTGRALVPAILRRGVCGAECLFEKRQTDPLCSADFLQRGRLPEFVFHHLGEQSELHRDHFAVVRQSLDGLLNERSFLGGLFTFDSGQALKGPAESGQHPAGVRQAEQVDGGAVVPFHQLDIEIVHEAGHGHPEVIADHHDALQSPAVAVPQRSGQFGPFVIAVGVQPLFELVEHDQHLPIAAEGFSAAQLGQRVGKSQMGWQERTQSPYLREQPGFSPLRRGFQINGCDPCVEAGQQSGFDLERRHGGHCPASSS